MTKFLRNYIHNFNQHDKKFKNNALKLFLHDKDSFAVSEETIQKLDNYSQDFPLNEINYELNGRIYTSHEGLLLKYEECFVRKFDNKCFDLSSHFLWIGKLFLFNFINIKKVKERII